MAHPDYPIPFKHSGHSEIFGIFAEKDITAPNTRRELRDALVGAGLLFAMHPPVRSGGKVEDHAPIRAFIHPGYMQAAFQGLPVKPNKGAADKWLALAKERLTDFSAQPEAHRIVIDGIVEYYAQIAQASTTVKGRKGVYLAAYPARGEETAPLAYAGLRYPLTKIAGVSYPIDNPSDTAVIKYEERLHIPVIPMMRKVAWRIPDIERLETLQAITNGLSAPSMNDEQSEASGIELPIDPYSLFRLGMLATGAAGAISTEPVRDIFQ